jgi:hypothetical protein
MRSADRIASDPGSSSSSAMARTEHGAIRRVWVDAPGPGNGGVLVRVDHSIPAEAYALIRFDDGAITSVPLIDEGKRWGFEDPPRS